MPSIIYAPEPAPCYLCARTIAIKARVLLLDGMLVCAACARQHELPGYDALDESASRRGF